MAGSYTDSKIFFFKFIQNAVNFFPSCVTVSVCRIIPFLLISHLNHPAAGFMHPSFIVFPLLGASSDICTIHYVYPNYSQAI